MSLKSFERFTRTIGFQLTLVYSAIFILSSLILFALTYYFLSFSIQQKDREAVLLEFMECASQYQKGGLEALQNEVAFEKLTRGDNPFLVRLAGPGNNTLFFNPPGGFSLARTETTRT